MRRDKNEEPTLVSYIVPELNEWPKFLKTQGLEDVEDEGTDIGPTKVYFKRFRRMQTEVRDHLKGRLPAYAVPTTYVSPKHKSVQYSIVINTSPDHIGEASSEPQRKG